MDGRYSVDELEFTLQRVRSKLKLELQRSHPFGTFSRSSLSQTSASESLGARQSPRGESEPPEPTFGPLGIALRLNWLCLKKRRTKTSSQRLMAARSYCW